ncbi:ABC transporter substrate-binding protein [Thermomonospora umbrina]|uniref:Iron complex transport system substrate-binding protein n=1 Tax=Thermomonospora umbrina TaxID=111806 RepID=A0A3D9SV88_9ACTN|nr:ABC transporter substrate-binding protein [Thermomonospora umbrina]REE96484.1 iron complex transport system substrate-binding protein [Thermomonospora umbrina]
MFTSRRPRALVGVTALALAAAACGGSDAATDPSAAESDGPPAATAYPLTIDNCGVKVTFKEPPRKVLILNGLSVGEAQSFVLLGLQGRVLANAQFYAVSDDPTMVKGVGALPKGGLTQNKNFDVPAEQVLKAEPDLVVSAWSGGFDAKQGLATREQLAGAGINTLVNPVNCAKGKPEADADEKKAYTAQSVDSGLRFLTLLGRIFDVQARAAVVVKGFRDRIDAVRTRVAGRPAKKVLIVYPGMSMMNANGLPAVMTGGVYDDVIEAAGGVNAFAGRAEDATRSLNKEQLAAAQVDVLVVGRFTPGDAPEAEAAKLFAAFPQWNASRTKTFTVISDSAYLGPLNALGVEKIAKAVHPGG